MADQDTLKYIEDLNSKFAESEPHEVLSYFINKYKDKIAFSSSLGLEDQVITHIIASISKNAYIFTLDTGRLFPETYDLIEKTRNRYGINLNVVFPDAKEVEEMVNSKGINLFFESVENRKQCCNIRKTRPLTKTLKNMQAWITGIRSQQSDSRQFSKLVEWDEGYGLIKLNPLINWSEQDVNDFISEHNIPYNILHDKGFPSIGCQPCTRAIMQGENNRDGRWWWENPDSKECGIHKLDAGC